MRIGTRLKGDEVVKKSIVAAVVIALAGVIAGCGTGTKSGEAQKDSTANAAEGKVTKIVVGTGTAFPRI